MILLDTHALLWMDLDDPSLGTVTRDLVQRGWEEGRLCVSAVSFWECALLHRRARIHTQLEPQAWRADLLAAGLVELPLDGESAILACTLEMPQRDPADRFIAATAVTHHATLVTADRALLKWHHPLPRQDAAE